MFVGKGEFAPSGADIEGVPELSAETLENILTALVELITAQFAVVEVDPGGKLSEADGKGTHLRLVLPEFSSAVAVAGAFVGGIRPVKGGKFASFILQFGLVRPGAVLAVGPLDIGIAL